MRKLRLGLLVGTVLLLLLATVAVANAQTPQGSDKARTPELEKIEFIHWKRDFAKPSGSKGPKPPSCYTFLTQTKVKWRSLPVRYVINPTNPQGLEEGFITAAISAGAETWDAATPVELMNGYSVDSTATYGVQDYKNVIAFGNYPQAGVIAITTVWYNVATKSIVEFDMLFDTDWTWGDASVVTDTMDLQNIATHEFGHAVGLGDVYQDACSAVTMYGYSDYGDIDKRTLESPDIQGLLTLYP